MAAMRVREQQAAAPATMSAAKMAKKATTKAVGKIVDMLGHHSVVQGLINAEMAKPLDAEYQTLSALRYWTAFARVKKPAKTPEAYEWVCEALNIGMILCENGLGAECLPIILAAQDAAYLAWPRAQTTGFYQLDAKGIDAIARALEVHDAQLAVVTLSEIAAAERTLIKRLHEGNSVSIDSLAA